MTTEDIINAIIEREGGYTDHPADRGGPTNYGITKATLEGWLGRPVSAQEVQQLSRAQAVAIYLELYVVRSNLHMVQDAWLRGFLVDAAVNHGVGAAVKLLQRALGVAADGVFGMATKNALASADIKKLRAGAVANRVRLFGRILSKNPTQAVFAAGWLNRAAEFVEQLS